MKTPSFRKIDCEIPTYWTPEQALAVFDLLDDLREKIFAYYGRQIQELTAEQQRPNPGDLIEIDEQDLPF
jgi:hypothetical protein